MQINRTKYSYMKTGELISFADNHIDSLSPLGQELLYRLAVLHSGGNGNNEHTKEFLERQSALV